MHARQLHAMRGEMKKEKTQGTLKMSFLRYARRNDNENTRNRENGRTPARELMVEKSETFRNNARPVAHRSVREGLQAARATAVLPSMCSVLNQHI